MSFCGAQGQRGHLVNKMATNSQGHWVTHSEQKAAKDRTLGANQGRGQVVSKKG